MKPVDVKDVLRFVVVYYVRGDKVLRLGQALYINFVHNMHPWPELFYEPDPEIALEKFLEKLSEIRVKDSGSDVL